MIKLRQFRQGLKNPFTSRKAQLINKVKSDPSWRGEISLGEAALMLKGSQPFTYVLSAGMDQAHFFLSYVDAHCGVRHKNVRVLLSQGRWCIKNGSTGTYEAIAPLIPDCLHCSEGACKPLK